MREHGLQNEIRNALVSEGLIFRANVGQAWAGTVEGKLPNGSLILGNPRPFSTGLPKGFSDLFGFRAVEITPDMVGKKIACFVALEIKTPTGRASADQSAFLRAVELQGGRAGVARSVADALAIIRGEKGN